MLKCKYCHNRDTWDIYNGNLKSINEIISEIEKYKNYIVPSGGGITATGGEPLLQTDFLINLFKKLKELEYHTCIDTSGGLPLTENIKELLRYTDLVLLDIKHINDEKAKDLCGISNKNTLAFAKYLNDNSIKMWIRQVIVPGITDDIKDLKNLKLFIDSLKTVEKIELLPYHSMGKFKWKEMGYEYLLDGVRDATDEDIKLAKEIMEMS